MPWHTGQKPDYQSSSAFRCCINELVDWLTTFDPSDSSSEQGGASEVHWGGGDAESSAASEHRPILRLLEVDAEGPQMHHPGDGAHDVRDPQDVSSWLKKTWFYVVTLLVLVVFSLVPAGFSLLVAATFILIPNTHQINCELKSHDRKATSKSEYWTQYCSI